MKPLEKTLKLHLFVLKRLIAFKPAFSGISKAVKSEAAVQVHVFATAVVLIFCAVYELPLTKIFQLLGICFIVISAELFNTAIEKLCDIYSTKRCEEIKYIKDLAAGAVLCVVVIAVFLVFRIVIYS